MEEKQVTMDGQTYLMPPPFLVIATQNPVEQEGTYRLPEAQLDRFLFKVQVDYPSLDEEVVILDKAQSSKGKFNEVNIKSVLNAEMIADIRQKSTGSTCRTRTP